MSLSANAGAYRSKPIFASHSAIGCTVVITRGFGSEKAGRDAILSGQDMRGKWPDKDQSGGETLVRCALHS